MSRRVRSEAWRGDPEVLDRLAGQYGVVLAVAYFGICLTLYRQPLKKVPRAAGVLLGLLLFLTGVHFLTAPAFLTRNQMISLFWNEGKRGAGGGILGALISIASVYFFARTGTIIILVACSVIAIILLTGIPLVRMFHGVGSGIKTGGHGIGQRLLDFLFVEEEMRPASGGHPGYPAAGTSRDAKQGARESTLPMASR